MNEEQLSELEALEQAATPRPWQGYEDSCCAFLIGPDAENWFNNTICGGESAEGYVDLDSPDFRFIIALRNAAPDLFAEVRRLRAALTRYANRGNWDNVYIHAWGHEGIAWAPPYPEPAMSPWDIAREALDPRLDSLPAGTDTATPARIEPLNERGNGDDTSAHPREKLGEADA